MHTENEAKKLWCPMTRYSAKDTGGEISWPAAINRWFSKDDIQSSPAPACCIASGCAMWRWAGWITCDEHGHPVGRLEKSPNDCIASEVSEETVQRVGYCGLAGVPG